MQIIYHHRILARDGMRVHVEEGVAALTRRGHAITMVGPGETAGDGDHDGDASADRSLTARLGGLRHRLPKAVGEILEAGYNLKARRQLAAAIAGTRPAVLYERYNAFLTAGLWAKRRSGLPLLVEVNAPLCDERKSLDNLALEPWARQMEHAVWRGADALFPVSDALAEHLRAAGVAEDRIHIMPNGVRLEHFSAEPSEAGKAALGLAGRRVVGFVGFVRPWHGLDRVLRAVAGLGDRDVHILIVGDGPAIPDLRRLTWELGLDDQVTITGVVPHDAVPGYLAAFDIALQPDVTAYASPLKLFEYMAARCAVIAPDRANIREIVADGETALLIAPQETGALEAALVQYGGDDGGGRRAGRTVLQARWLTGACRDPRQGDPLCDPPLSLSAGRWRQGARLSLPAASGPA